MDYTCLPFSLTLITLFFQDHKSEHFELPRLVPARISGHHTVRNQFAVVHPVGGTGKPEDGATQGWFECH